MSTVTPIATKDVLFAYSWPDPRRILGILERMWAATKTVIHLAIICRFLMCMLSCFTKKGVSHELFVR